MDVYTKPLYYEIAFSFVNPQKQADLLEEFIRKYSRIEVERFLDLGCGPALQLRELAKRGYEAVGLDIHSEMLEYVEERSHQEGTTIELVNADFNRFTLEKKVDFAFIMMGTISYVKSNNQFLAHLDSVANSLKKGGLYLIENFRLDWASPDFFGPESWVMERNGIKVKTTYDIQLKDTLTQMLTETMVLEVDDQGRKVLLQESVDTKMIFPHEFLTLILLNNKFEFIGWFERDQMKELTRANLDNIILLRRF